MNLKKLLDIFPNPLSIIDSDYVKKAWKEAQKVGPENSLHQFNHELSSIGWSNKK